MHLSHAGVAGGGALDGMVHNPRMGKSTDERYSEQETVRRREAALQRMLKTPPQHHATVKSAKKAKQKKRKQPKISAGHLD